MMGWNWDQMGNWGWGSHMLWSWPMMMLGGLLLVGLALRRSQNTAHLLGIPESSQVAHTAAK